MCYQESSMFWFSFTYPTHYYKKPVNNIRIFKQCFVDGLAMLQNKTTTAFATKCSWGEYDTTVIHVLYTTLRVYIIHCVQNDCSNYGIEVDIEFERKRARISIHALQVNFSSYVSPSCHWILVLQPLFPAGWNAQFCWRTSLQN